MPKLLVSDPISQEGLGSLLQDSEIELVIQTGLSEDELCGIIGEFDGLLVRSQTRVNAKVLEHATNLRVIGRAGVGVDNIDVETATKRGIAVINAPDGNTITTAEYSFAMLMALARNIPQAHASLKEGKWDRKTYVGVELNNKVLGVLGLGRIGTEVAKRALAFGMKILAFDPFLTDARAADLGVKKASVDEIVAQADFITVHTPLTKETKHLIAKREFSMMKQGVRILNCARGGIIEEEALVGALQEGIVAGVALDVYEAEPLALDHPLRSFPNVIHTPHLGASTIEAQLNVAIDVANEVRKYLHDEPFKNAVNLPSLSADKLKQVEPYLELGQKLGNLAANFVTGNVTKLQVTYSGNVASVEVGAITRTILKGFLSHHHVDVNIVNATYLADHHGISVQQTTSKSTKVFTSLIAVEVEADGIVTRVVGTLYNGFGPRIVEINGYTLDTIPQGQVLFTRHVDQPGIIGLIGTILGEEHVNIATMQVGRNEQGGMALMVLGVDGEVADAALDAIRALPGVYSLRQVTF